MVRGLFMACAALLVVGRSALADENLRRAREEFANVELERAERSLRASLASGKNSRAELVEVYMLAGQIAATLGQVARAEDRFRRALALDPDAVLVEVAPKLRAPLARARRLAQDDGPLRIRHLVSRLPERAVIVHVSSDPMRMVAEARLTDLDSGETIRVKGTGDLRLPVSGEERRDVVVSVHDRHGNQLESIGSRSLPIVVEAIDKKPRAARSASGPSGLVARAAAPRPKPRRSLLGRWYVWTGAGLVVAGGVSLPLFIHARGRYEDLEDRYVRGELSDVEQEALSAPIRREALIADVSLGVAAGLVLVGTVLGVRDLAADPSPQVVEAGLAPTDGGATATVKVRF